MSKSICYFLYNFLSKIFSQLFCLLFYQVLEKHVIWFWYILSLKWDSLLTYCPHQKPRYCRIRHFLEMDSFLLYGTFGKFEIYVLIILRVFKRCRFYHCCWFFYLFFVFVFVFWILFRVFCPTWELCTLRETSQIAVKGFISLIGFRNYI